MISPEENTRIDRGRVNSYWQAQVLVEAVKKILYKALSHCWTLFIGNAYAGLKKESCGL